MDSDRVDSPNSSSYGCTDPHPNATDHIQRRLIITLAICTAFMAVEAIGGYLSGSLAIISDAAHLLSDIAGFSVSLFTMVLARRPPSKRYTFGLHRAEIVGALLSISIVWLVTGWLIFEAIQRIRDPQPIEGRIMMIVAGFGVIANIAMGLALHDPRPRQILSVTESGQAQLLPTHHHDHHQHENMNVRAALLHVLGDLAQSVGVFLASLLVAFYPSALIVDPICTLLSSFLVLGSTSYLAKDILDVIMEAVPRYIHLDELAEQIQSCSVEITEVADLHIWALAPGKTLITFKLRITPQGNTVLVLKACKQMLAAKYGIHHSTIQLEKDER